MNSTLQDRFYLDTNSVIAILEQARRLTEAQEQFLDNLDSGAIFVCSSEIALTECLVMPVRNADLEAIQRVLRFFSDERVLPVVSMNRAISICAAELRALSYLQLPDAIHVACALDAGCTIFVSADKRLRMPASMRRVAFDDIALSGDVIE